MDPIQFPENLSELTADVLAQLATDTRAQIGDLVALGDRGTPADAREAERLAAGLVQVDAETADRAGAAARLAAVGASLAAEPEPEPEPEPAADPEPEAAADPVVTPAVPADPAPEAPASEAGAAVVQLNQAAVAGARPPAAVVTQPNLVTQLRAASGINAFEAGQEITSLQMAEALLDKFERYPKPMGKSKEFGRDLSVHPLAAIDLGIPDELTITEGMSAADIQKVFDLATDEKRLPQGSLVAAGGWCAPSPVDYGLADDGASTDGLWDAPTVALGRGGLRFTLGPDFADIYALSNYFKMTEAQAIAGSFTKPCFTVTCPTFSDHRMDAYGYCFQVPFLTEAGYPEIIRRYLSGSLTVYRHKIDLEKITQMLALLPAAEVAAVAGSTAFNLADALLLIIDRERTKRRWAFNAPVQVDLPMWVRGAIKSDIGKRTARNTQAVSDAEVNAIFTQANATVRWLYNWQPLGAAVLAYPATFDMAIYKAGTFVVGTTNVVNLSSVYDAASLANNIYTGAFFEEGMNVMRRGFGGVRVTVAVCNSGNTGAANIDLCV